MPTAGKMCLAVDFNKRINRNGWLVQRVIRFSDAQIQEKIPSPFPVRGSILIDSQLTRAGAAQRAGKIRCSKAHFEKGRRRAPDALLVG